MAPDRLNSLEWKEEGPSKGTKTIIKEVPYMKNNKRADQEEEKRKEAAEAAADTRTEK